MVVRVAQRAALSRARQVVVAADDARIVAACERHGVRALLTRTDHASGSDRLAEACVQLGLDGADGGGQRAGRRAADRAGADRCLRGAAGQRTPTARWAPSRIRSTSVADYLNPNVVKVVLDRAGRALLFSRAPLPWWRDGPAADAARQCRSPCPTRRPCATSACTRYRADFLRRFPDPADGAAGAHRGARAVARDCGTANASRCT